MPEPPDLKTARSLDGLRKISRDRFSCQGESPYPHDSYRDPLSFCLPTSAFRQLHKTEPADEPQDKGAIREYLVLT